MHTSSSVRHTSVQASLMNSCRRSGSPFSSFQRVQLTQHCCMTWGTPIRVLATTGRRATFWIEKALRIKEAHHGPEHVEVARTLGNLGIAYGYLGEYGKMCNYLENALRIEETHYGPEHVQVAI
eukprot:1537967-Amphidinium_carterae.1